MKAKKMVLLLVSLCMVLSLPLVANAGQAWYTGYTITSAGPMVVAGGVTVNRIGATCTKTGSPTLNCWFTAGREKEMLAVALTAMANGKTVDALVDSVLVNGRYTIMDLMLK